MELQIPEFHQVNSRVSKSLGIFCKHSSVDLEITIQDRSFPIKLTLERKAYSDYFYHQDSSLLKSEYIFYLKTLSGTWYPFSTLNALFTFIGYQIKEELFSKILLDLELSSEFKLEEFA